MINPPCDRCGSTRTFCRGLSNQNYPACWTCYDCSPYGHDFDGPDPPNRGYPADCDPHGRKLADPSRLPALKGLT